MNNPVKLAIVGASSTGKTTLITHLEKKYLSEKDVVFVHESAREFFTNNPGKIDFSLAVQKQILSLVFENEKKALEKSPRVIITDTSAIETALYTQVEGDQIGASELLKDIQPWIKTYTKFLLLNPNDVQFENDMIRKETEETRNKIHELLIAFYKQHNLPFFLISGTIPEREKRVGDIINTYLTL